MSEEFLKMYDRYFDDIYRYVYSKVGNKWDTDDIVSNTFMCAYQHRDTTKGDSKAWLFAIAHNTVVDFYRKKNREVSDNSICDRIDIPFEEDIEHRDEMVCLKRVLQQLDEEQFEVISMHYFAGLKYSQIAQILGINEGAAKMRVHRTLKRIKEMWERCL